jgi:molybdopterin-containing oxidoreductase family membrane subunit
MLAEPPTEIALQAAAFRPVLASGRWFWPLFAALGLVVVAAAAAYAYQLAAGLWVAGYNDTAFYGIYEANLVAFIGVSYGGALVSAVLRLTNARWRAPITRMAEAMALVSLVVGGSFAIIHLGRPERIWQLIARPQAASPIVWDVIAITTYLAATVIFLYLPLIPDLAIARDRLGPSAGRLRRTFYRLTAAGWTGTPAQRQRLNWSVGAIAVLIIPLAITVHSVLAWAFSMTSRPGWHSTIFGPYFVIGALYSGVALVIVVVAAFRRAYRLEPHIGLPHFVSLARIMAVLGAVYLYFTFSEMLTTGYVRTRDEASIVAVLLEGSFAPAFWTFMIGGILVPIALSLAPATRQVRYLVLAAVLAVAGMWLKRLLITLPTATAPLIGDVWGSVQFTWVAIVVTLGATAAIPLGLMIIFRLVPILALDEMMGVGGEHATQSVPDTAIGVEGVP